MLLVGWSHKYQEVLDFFKLGQYAIDFSELTAQSLNEEFVKFASAEKEILKNIEENYDAVMESSRQNIVYASQVIDEIVSKPSAKRKYWTIQIQTNISVRMRPAEKDMRLTRVSAKMRPPGHGNSPSVPSFEDQAD